jgi:hypothetical protein
MLVRCLAPCNSPVNVITLLTLESMGTSALLIFAGTVSCRTFSGIPGLCPPYAHSTFLQV